MKIVRILLVVLLFCTLVFLAILQLAPVYLSRNIIPAIAQKHGLANLSLNIQTITSKTITIGDFRLGTKKDKGLSIATTTVSFHPARLSHGELDSLIINGLQCYLTLVNGEIRIAGLNLPKSKNRPANHPFAKDDAFALFNNLPVTLTDIQIKNSRCTLEMNNGKIIIPFDLRIHFADRNEPHIEVSLDLFLMGTPISVSAIFDLKNNTFQSDILAGALPISSANLPLTKSPLNISAICDLKGAASGSIFPFSLLHNFSIALSDLKVDYQNLKFVNTQPQAGKEQKSLIFITGTDKTLEAYLEGISMLEPIPINFKKMNIKLLMSDSNITSAGDLLVTVPPVTIDSFHLLAPITALSNFDFKITGKKIKANTTTILNPEESSSLNELFCTIGEHHFRAQPGELSLSFDSSPESNRIQYQTFFHAIQNSISNPEQTNSRGLIKGKNLSLKGSISEIIKKSERERHGDFILATNELLATTPDISGETSFRLTGHIKQSSKDSSPQFSGSIKLENGQIFLSKENITCSKITANLPLAWPLRQNMPQNGSLEIADIKKAAYDLGSFSTNIGLLDGTYTLDSTFLSKIIPDLVGHIKTTVLLDATDNIRVDISLNLPKYHFDSTTINLPLFADFETTGDIEALGSMAITPKGSSGGYRVIVDDATIHAFKSDLVVDGIHLNLEVPSFQSLKSSPSLLSFNKVAIGKIQVTEGKALLQLEPPKEILIENSSINWSGGKVNLLGTRLTTGKKRQEILLYCNGLNLAELLSQFGIVNAKGDGQVNGKIALSIENGALAFSDAFLYSTPGTGGTIQINNSAIILGGVPSTSPQFGQLDFASAALRDFSYKWVTLNLSTENDDTTLALKLSGKPANPLPFKYDTKQGTFVRMSRKGEGIDYPINLDVNFHLPLNKILNYGTNLKDIFKR